MKTQITLRVATSFLIIATLACSISGTESVPVDATGTFNAVLTQANATERANQPSATAVAPITVVAPTNTSAPPTNTNPPSSATYTRVPSTSTHTRVPSTRTATPTLSASSTPIIITTTPIIITATPTTARPPSETPLPPPTATATPTTQPPTVPAAPRSPSNFSAEGNGTTIEFDWTDNSANETGFRIYQVGEAAPVLTRPAQAATGRASYTWTNRPCNVSATFVIRAYSQAGESASSNSDSAVTIPCAPSRFNAYGMTAVDVDVVFTDNATNETGFRIYRNYSVVQTLSARTGSGRTKEGSLTQICGENYTYYARAYNSAGESPPSNDDWAVTGTCTVTVNFTSVQIYDDEDPAGSGELIFAFNVNGQTRRWPSSGNIDADTGDTRTIRNTSITLNIMRATDLEVKVEGVDVDSDLLDDTNDSLGRMYIVYEGSNGWSEGSHCTDSAHPRDFRICYTITVTP